MNANMTPPGEEALDKVLRQWTVAAPVPPRFQEQVWQRIAKTDQRSEAATLSGLWRMIEGVVRRPRIAYAYLAVLMTIGVAAGAWAAQVKTTRLDSELSLRYVQAIDPYRADSPHP